MSAIAPDELDRLERLARTAPEALTPAAWTRALWTLAEEAREPGETTQAALDRLVNTSARARAFWTAAQGHALTWTKGRRKHPVPHDTLAEYRAIIDAADPVTVATLRDAVRARHPVYLKPTMLARRLLLLHQAGDILLDPALPDAEIAVRVSARTGWAIERRDVVQWRKSAAADRAAFGLDDCEAA